MTLRTLCSRIAKQEGKKSSISIGDVREVIKILVDMEVSARVAEGVDLPSEILQLLNETASKKTIKELSKTVKVK